MSPANEKSSPGRRRPVGNSNAPDLPRAASRSSAGAARVAEPQQPRALVERLAGGVVERLAEHFVIGAGIAHAREQGVAAARDQAEERRLERLGTQERRGDVTVQVIDAAPAGSSYAAASPFAVADADQQRRDQSRDRG